MEHGYILSILYEMALVIGGEVSVKPLLTKMLQRLLYHTSFPAGFVCMGAPFPEADSAGMIAVRIDAAVGDYELAGLIGQTVRLPAQLLHGAAECGEDAASLAALLDKSRPYKAFLRLPIDGQGVIVLLAPQLPDSDLPLTQLFQPVMANLAKAIVLCRSHDAYTGGLIAERDASQLAMAASEEKFRAISSAVLDALIMVDDSSALVYWNPAAERILGYRADEALGKPLHQLLAPQRYQSAAIQGFDAFRGTGQGAVIGKTVEIEALHKDGHEIPVELSIAALKLNGRWHAVGILRDISEHKRAEEQLRRSAQDLAEAQRIARLGNWNLDLVNNVLVWSDEIYRIFEIDPKQFGASYEAFLNAIHPDDRELVDNAYAESLKNKTTYEIAHRLLMRDGRVKYVNEKCETYYGGDGKPLRSVGTVHDITELKRAEDEVNALNRDLEQRVAERTAQLETANKELEAFAYSVSHDLRAPLRAIDGFTGILLDDYTDKLDEEGRRLLNVVRDNTIRMGQLIDDILKFSRTGRVEIFFSEIDMGKLAREVLQEFQSAAAGGKLQVEIDAIPPARGDRAMLHQVFVNLLSNAIKFSRTRETPRIKLGCIIEGDEAVYFVRDNGVGFDMQYADKLFGVFQRLHGEDEFEGTGIGLAIVKRIVTRHGGRVWAEGKLDGGATVYFALPAKEGNAIGSDNKLHERPPQGDADEKIDS